MNRPPRGLARFDSAAGMALALADYLHGRPFTSPSQSPLLDRVMPAFNLLPRRAREWAYSIGGMTEGIDARRARHFDMERVAEWLVGLYPERPYPAVFVGSSNGALTHLAAALGVPWLPQTFLCPIRAPFSDPDDAQRGFEKGRPIVDALLAADSRIAVHHMQDPNQDRLMLRSMSYFRLKYRALPLGYREFLLRNLPTRRNDLRRRLFAFVAGHAHERTIGVPVRRDGWRDRGRIPAWRRARARVSGPLRPRANALAAARAERRVA